MPCLPCPSVVRVRLNSCHNIEDAHVEVVRIARALCARGCRLEMQFSDASFVLQPLLDRVSSLLAARSAPRDVRCTAVRLADAAVLVAELVERAQGERSDRALVDEPLELDVAHAQALSPAQWSLAGWVLWRVHCWSVDRLQSQPGWITVGYGLSSARASRIEEALFDPGVVEDGVCFLPLPIVGLGAVSDAPVDSACDAVLRALARECCVVLFKASDFLMGHGEAKDAVSDPSQGLLPGTIKLLEAMQALRPSLRVLAGASPGVLDRSIMMQSIDAICKRFARDAALGTSKLLAALPWCRVELANGTLATAGEANAAQASALLALRHIPLPAVLKPLQACGAPASHRLSVLRQIRADPQSGERVAWPCVAQAVPRHGDCVFKVVCVGESCVILRRPSIENLAFGPSAGDLVSFSSHDLPRGVSGACAEREPAELEALVGELACYIAVEFDLVVFGFDLIRDAESGTFSVVDVNHLPDSTAVFPRARACLCRALNVTSRS